MRIQIKTDIGVLTLGSFSDFIDFEKFMKNCSLCYHIAGYFGKFFVLMYILILRMDLEFEQTRRLWLIAVGDIVKETLETLFWKYNIKQHIDCLVFGLLLVVLYGLFGNIKCLFSLHLIYWPVIKGAIELYLVAFKASHDC